MLAEIIDIVLSLSALMEEESDKLLSGSRHPDLPELTAAKVRLVATLEARTAQFSREKPNWLAELGPEEREQLAAGMRYMMDAALVNADVLKRQIDLSAEMMAAVAAEAQRLMGTNNATYGRNGGLSQIEQATPISLNARF